MPTQVPYSGTLDTQPQIDPLPQAHIDTPTAAFGGAVAQAISHVGEVSQQAGKELFARADAMQTLHEHAVANTAVSSYQNDLDQAYLKFTENRGGDALSAYTQFQKDADDLRDKYSKGMSSPYSQFLFDQESRQYRGRVVFAAGQYSHQQFKQFQDESGAARIASVGTGLAITGDQPGAVKEGLDIAEREAGTIAANKGFKPGTPEYDQTVRTMSSTALEPVIKKYLSGDSLALTRGKALLNGFQDKYPELYAKYNEEFKLRERTVGAQEQAAIWFKNNGEAYDLPSAMKAAQVTAERLFKDDDLAQEAFVTDVRRQKLQATENVKVDRDAAVEMVTNGVYGRMSKDGKLPTSSKELFALDPAMEDQYNKLSAMQKKQVDNTLERNITGGWRPTDASRAIYDTLRYAAIDPNASPADRQKLLDTFVPGLPIPGEWADKLMRMQKALRNGEQTDPHMTRALAAIEPLIGTAGVGLTNDKTAPAYKQFVARYRDAIDGYTQGNVKPITDDQTYRDIAKALLADNKQMPQSSFFSFGGTSFPKVYEKPGTAQVRNEMAQKLREKYKAMGSGIEPTDEDIDQAVAREIFRRSGAIDQLKAPSQ